ncbi:MAG: hypothetical protein BJ554DRAFT_951 [Olpidium bornovanus]|uniref:Uncharacterized protein n=1 Tax=Olpidium bornovanus TaxID=278681 RepID=A0A8H8DHS4_9FUNG|nr:MAG: hypothetical protein BJ554DRAFT_951 [Olpidium bornovanus]
MAYMKPYMPYMKALYVPLPPLLFLPCASLLFSAFPQPSLHFSPAFLRFLRLSARSYVDFEPFCDFGRSTLVPIGYRCVEPDRRPDGGERRQYIPKRGEFVLLLTTAKWRPAQSASRDHRHTLLASADLLQQTDWKSDASPLRTRPPKFRKIAPPYPFQEKHIWPSLPSPLSIYKI